MNCVAMHIKDGFDNWFDAYVIDKGGILSYRRLGHMRPLDIIDDFNKLSQKGDIESYQEGI